MNRRNLMQGLVFGFAGLFAPIFEWLDRKEDAWFKGTAAGKRLGGTLTDVTATQAWTEFGGKIGSYKIVETDYELGGAQLQPRQKEWREWKCGNQKPKTRLVRGWKEGEKLDGLYVFVPAATFERVGDSVLTLAYKDGEIVEVCASDTLKCFHVPAVDKFGLAGLQKPDVSSCRKVGEVLRTTTSKPVSDQLLTKEGWKEKLDGKKNKA
jgi:hypothetical protein